MLSSTYLFARCILHIIEGSLKSREQKCAPVPLPEKPTVSTEDVSLLIPTINTPDAFTDCMRLWLANKPREIIIVTIPRDLARVHELLAPLGDVECPVSVYTVPKPGRRAQMTLALQKAKGKIVAFVDDDTYWPTSEVLPHLLAPFENPAVGGATGRQSANVPLHRRQPSLVTPSEIGTLRALSTSSNKNEHFYATSGTLYCMIGRTMLIRAELLQSNSFYAALNGESWRGKPINTGDDGFITHWLRDQGWKLVYQSAPEAEVFTLVEQGERFVKQLIRWRRSGYRGYLRAAVEEPGLRKLWSDYPGYALRLTRFLLKPLSTVIEAVAWIHCAWHWPSFAVLLSAYYIIQIVFECLDFHKRHPWVGYRNLWAVAVMDHVAYQIINLYVVATLGAEGWLTRDDSDSGSAGKVVKISS